MSTLKAKVGRRRGSWKDYFACYKWKAELLLIVQKSFFYSGRWIFNYQIVRVSLTSGFYSDFLSKSISVNKIDLKFFFTFHALLKNN